MRKGTLLVWDGIALVSGTWWALFSGQSVVVVGDIVLGCLLLGLLSLRRGL
jgi:hypothetical protein